MTKTKHYAQRDIESLEPHYWNNLSAMTLEGLRSKASIAAELAFRDKRIAELEAALEQSHKCACMGAEISELFPVKFAVDWDCKPHPLLTKD